jgi:ketosteroid isomerase-like protein
VKSLRDGYDSAWGANGKIIDNLFNDFMVIWTCGDGRVFQRRESPDEIALVENFSPNKQTIKRN